MNISETIPRVPSIRRGFLNAVKARIFDWRWWFGVRQKNVLGPPPRMTITAIVPAYNEERSLINTVVSIVKQTYPVERVIIVDDCSRDNTLAIAYQLSNTFRNVWVIKTPKNTGTKARAQNYALQYVDTELFVSIDGDTMLARNAIERAMPYFNDPTAFAVCGFVIPQRIKTLWERGRLIDYLFGMTLVKPAQNHQGVVLVAAGCFTIFSTLVVEKLGGFNERTLAEDMDLTWEGIGAGYRVYFASNAACYAVDPPTMKIYVRQIERWTRGLAQNVSVRKYNIFKTNGALGTLVYFYLFSAFYGIFGAPILLWFWFSDFLVAVVLSVVFEIVVVGSLSLLRSLQFGLFWKALTSLPSMMLTTYVNRGVFLYSMIAEMVLGVKLTAWHKGH